MKKLILPKNKNNVHDYPGRCQPIVAVCPDGKVAGFFDSIQIAVDKYGFNRNGISLCCRGRQRLSGGLNWFYEKDYKQIYFTQDMEALKTPSCDTRNDNGTFKKGHTFNKGRKRDMTAEYRKNRRDNMLRLHAQGLLKPDPTRNFKAVIEIETGTIFPSIGHAAKATGHSYNGMRNLIKSPHKSRKTCYTYCLKTAWDRTQNIKLSTAAKDSRAGASPVLL